MTNRTINPIKLRFDTEKVQALEASGPQHPYSYHEWAKWTGDNYIKSYYDVLLPSGKIVKECWPNAGKLKSGGYSFDAASNVKVRLSASSPFLDDKEV